MNTIYDVKNYLRVDADFDDIQIKSLMDAAKSYMCDAIDDYTETYKNADKQWQAKADLAEKLLIVNWYEQRIPVGNVSSSVNLLLTQLQLHKSEALRNGKECNS